MFLYRWHEPIKELTSHLRENVLLPLDPRVDKAEGVFTDVQSGISLPLWHCPFQYCVANGKTTPCGATARATSTEGKPPGSYEKELWAHIRLCHNSVLRDVARKWDLFEKSMKQDEVCLTLFNSALAEKERSSLPLLGHSTDRRVLEHVRQVFRDDNVHVLMCFVCACKEVAHTGYDKLETTSRKGTSAIAEIGRKQFCRLFVATRTTPRKKHGDSICPRSALRICSEKPSPQTLVWTTTPGNGFGTCAGAVEWTACCVAPKTWCDV